MTKPQVDGAAGILDAVRSARLIPRVGRVQSYSGLTMEADGPDVHLGEVCEIVAGPTQMPVRAEVVGFRGDAVLLMPFGDVSGIRAGSEVMATGRSAYVPVGDALLGRVLDAFGAPIDGLPMPKLADLAPLVSNPPSTTGRERIRKPFETGVRVVDTCFPVGVGQRMGIFSGSGVGKSTLLGMIARNSAADVNVIALIGERGREVRDFLEDHLRAGLQRSIVIVATSDQPPLVRKHAASAAMAISEYFRRQGRSVALLFDSLTRLAMAQREIGLAAGEPPTARGYTPSVFSLFPALIERAGTGEAGIGAITAFFTVLVEGDEFDEPIADHARAILDGHLVLTRELAQTGHYPAIDPLQSISRLGRQIASPEHLKIAEDARAIWALNAKSRDMVEFGAYRQGANPALDRALRLAPKLAQFFQQDVAKSWPKEAAMDELRRLLL